LNRVDAFREKSGSTFLSEEWFPVSSVLEVPFHESWVAVSLNVCPDVVLSNDTSDFLQLASRVRLILYVVSRRDRDTKESLCGSLLVVEHCFSFDRVPDFNMVVLCVSS
jgi:hypothetical protein